MYKKLSSFSLLLLILLTTAILQAQVTFEKPKLSSPDSWSVILLPDPQTYVKFGRNQPLFELMTAWIEENIDSLNIKLALVTGDLVEQNEMMNPDGINGDQTSISQWESVSRSLGRLDGKLPYVVAAGNHDYGLSNAIFRRSNLNKYFPVNKNVKTQKILKEVCLNAEGYPTLENAGYELISPKGKKFLVLSLEFKPRDSAIEWAKKVISLPKYKDHTVLVLTHSYLNAKNQHIEKENYKVEGNYGAALFQKLIAPSKNIQMVFSGHIGAPDNIREHVGFRTDKNAGGKTVNQMVFNAQALGGGWHGNGGDGWLRIIEFMADGKTVKVKTFSPFFAISPTTQQHAWRRESWDEFSFQLD
jgi:hypothetical protein